MEKNPDEFIRRKRKEKFQIKIKNALKIIMLEKMGSVYRLNIVFR